MPAVAVDGRDRGDSIVKAVAIFVAVRPRRIVDSKTLMLIS